MVDYNFILCLSTFHLTNITFSGFMSRWMMPALWMNATAFRRLDVKSCDLIKD